MLRVLCAGTLFQQEYFTCDWWFNVDCKMARKLWSLNINLAAERQEYSRQANINTNYLVSDNQR